VEDDLELPVVHPVAARVWYVQKQMRTRQRSLARAGCWPNCRNGPTQQFHNENLSDRYLWIIRSWSS
jgi:hypothetical protein